MCVCVSVGKCVCECVCWCVGVWMSVCESVCVSACVDCLALRANVNKLKPKIFCASTLVNLCPFNSLQMGS